MTELGGHSEQWVRDLLFSAHHCGSSAFHAAEVQRLLAPHKDIADEVIRREENRIRRWNDLLHAAGVSRLAPVPTEQSFDGITGKPYTDGVALRDGGQKNG